MLSFIYNGRKSSQSGLGRCPLSHFMQAMAEIAAINKVATSIATRKAKQIHSKYVRHDNNTKEGQRR